MRLVSVWLLIALSACTHTVGTKIDDAALANLQPGKTTYAEVVRAFGPPSASLKNSDGLTILTYSRLEAGPRASTFIPIAGAFVGGADVHTSSVTLQFDGSGVLKSDR